MTRLHIYPRHMSVVTDSHQGSRIVRIDPNGRLLSVTLRHEDGTVWKTTMKPSAKYDIVRSV